MPFIQKAQELVIDQDRASKMLEQMLNFHKTSSIKTATINFIGSQLVSNADRQMIGRLFR
jgi:hypothetical protein